MTRAATGTMEGCRVVATHTHQVPGPQGKGSLTTETARPTGAPVLHPHTPCPPPTQDTHLTNETLKIFPSQKSPAILILGLSIQMETISTPVGGS